ncbi:hypothetical protein OSB04_027757 [Centaurea solstitialis]|uniref:Uncharacterized protein n=1 Tax=Centaurea solstitialis TaxID=347529 RepID=A0AA38WAI5_9ASTR|nr:hypothetical protein OSB04_027757 [Centaurea solstitialis]
MTDNDGREHELKVAINHLKQFLSSIQRDCPQGTLLPKGAQVQVDSMSKVAHLEGAGKEKMREKVQKMQMQAFLQSSMMLLTLLSGEIASTFDNPESVKLEHYKLN